MNTDKHGLKKRDRRKSSPKLRFSLPPEPKLSKKEQAEVDRAWRIEIRRRLADFRAGKTKCIPAYQVMRNAYGMIDGPDRLQRLVRTKNHIGQSGLRKAKADRD